VSSTALRTHDLIYEVLFSRGFYFAVVFSWTPCYSNFLSCLACKRLLVFSVIPQKVKGKHLKVKVELPPWNIWKAWIAQKETRKQSNQSNSSKQRKYQTPLKYITCLHTPRQYSILGFNHWSRLLDNHKTVCFVFWRTVSTSLSSFALDLKTESILRKGYKSAEVKSWLRESDQRDFYQFYVIPSATCNHRDVKVTSSRFHDYCLWSLF